MKDQDMKSKLKEIDDLLEGITLGSGDYGRKPEDDQSEGGFADYSLAGLNVKGKYPLSKIIEAVKRFRDGSRRPDVDKPRLNILIYGAPGSGKTAFVNHLVQEVGAPIHIVKASELMSKWIGETEQNIAKEFKKAKSDNAILFLDEIDSFLQDRKTAEKSWEVVSVNELLQQMESFGGVVIGATNFKENLDPAVMRRFTFKIELDYLTDDGKRIFFERYFKTPLTLSQQQRLDLIDKLTPGDFRTVKEELFYLVDEETNDIRLEALEEESRMKQRDVRRKIGFAA